MIARGDAGHFAFHHGPTRCSRSPLRSQPGLRSRRPQVRILSGTPAFALDSGEGCLAHPSLAFTREPERLQHLDAGLLQGPCSGSTAWTAFARSQNVGTMSYGTPGCHRLWPARYDLPALPFPFLLVKTSTTKSSSRGWSLASALSLTARARLSARLGTWIDVDDPATNERTKSSNEPIRAPALAFSVTTSPGFTEMSTADSGRVVEGTSMCLLRIFPSEGPFFDEH